MIAENNVAYIGTETTLTVVLNGQNRTIQIKSIPQRNEIIIALEKFKKSSQSPRDLATLETLLAPIKRAVVESDHRFELDPEGRRLYLAGSSVVIPEKLTDKIMDFLEHKLPVDALVKFWESCLRNPHYIAVTELFNFLTENQLPITDDGGFLGYKKLNFVKGQETCSVPDIFEELIMKGDSVYSLTGSIVTPTIARKYKEFIENTKPVMVDVHSGKIQQKVGEIVRIERIKLGEEDRRNECGYGLHCGAFSYSFSGNVRVLCKIFPEDVIACNEGQAKLRTCKYQIVSFVDSDKEVKEMLVNLNREEQDVVDGDYNDGDWTEEDFEAGQTVRCIIDDASYSITNDAYYYVIECDGGEILIVDDEGEQNWVDASLFQLKD